MVCRLPVDDGVYIVSLSMLTSGITLIVTLAFAAHACYWILLLAGFRKSSHAAAQSEARADPPTPMTVIVAARNEAKNLPSLLRALRRQDHPNYEVIVVDDGSTDGTVELLDSWAGRFGRLRVLRTNGLGKKAALSRGIDAARYDVLALTDADCVPPPAWLSKVAREHAACRGDCVLVGYSPFARGRGFLNRIARYETFVTGFLTAAAVGLRRPYMAVGRNISYPRSLFDRVGGFASIMHSLSGDDDLFVQAAAQGEGADVRALLDPDTFVRTAAPATMREWLRQKRRHASAGRYYHWRIQAHLAGFHGSNLLVWLAPVLAGWIGVLLLGTKLALQYVVLREAASRLHERDLMPIQPLLEVIYVLYAVVVAPIGLIRMPKRW